MTKTWKMSERRLSAFIQTIYEQSALHGVLGMAMRQRVKAVLPFSL